jgi:hypothetical protein
MKKRILPFLCLCFCATLAHAQKIEPGYLVVNRGDTLRGEVENVFWDDPLTTVRFRAKTTDRLVTYSARQLRSVYLGSGRLLRKELLPVDRTAQTEVNRLPTTSQGEQHPDSVMADVLVVGPATLLGIRLHSVNHFFVRREQEPYLEMTERRYLVPQKGIMVIADGNDYKSQLIRYFGDCEAATNVIPRTRFTGTDLKAVVQAYNQQCSAARQAGQEVTSEKLRQGKIAVRLGLITGARYNSLRLAVDNNTTAELNGLNADGRLHGQGGIYFDLMNSGRRAAIHSALLVSQIGRPGAVAYSPRSVTRPNSYEWHGTLASLQLGLRGFVPIGEHYNLLFGAGYEVNRFFKLVSEITYTNSDTYSFVNSFNGWLPPYLEAGLSRDRLALTLNGRVYEKQYFNSYGMWPWSLSASLSFRLTANSDLK